MIWQADVSQRSGDQKRVEKAWQKKNSNIFLYLRGDHAVCLNTSVLVQYIMLRPSGQEPADWNKAMEELFTKWSADAGEEIKSLGSSKAFIDFAAYYEIMRSELPNPVMPPRKHAKAFFFRFQGLPSLQFISSSTCTYVHACMLKVKYLIFFSAGRWAPESAAHHLLIQQWPRSRRGIMIWQKSIGKEYLNSQWPGQQEASSEGAFDPWAGGSSVCHCSTKVFWEASSGSWKPGATTKGHEET